MNIKPLQWTKTVEHYQGYYPEGYRQLPEEYEITYLTSTPFGDLSVKLLSQFDIEDKVFYRSVTYHYCFSEYTDEYCGTCGSLLDGKRRLEKIWCDRLMKCLEEENND